MAAPFLDISILLMVDIMNRDPLDDESLGVEVGLGVGDAIVLPAGVAHCCLESDGEYEYVGLYTKVSPLPLSRSRSNTTPLKVIHSLSWKSVKKDKSTNSFTNVTVYKKGSPHWDNNFCHASASETQEKAANARAVPIPECDPIYGKDGHLVRI